MNTNRGKNKTTTAAAAGAKRPRRQRRLWKDRELEILYNCARRFRGRSDMWVRVAEYLPGRTNREARQRYMRDSHSDSRYRRWTLVEESQLFDHVVRYGAARWGVFAEKTQKEYHNARNHWYVMRRRAGVAAEEDWTTIVDTVSAYLESRAQDEERKAAD